MDDEAPGSSRHTLACELARSPRKWPLHLLALIIETRRQLARLEALENDNAVEAIEINEDDEASLDDDDEQVYMTRQSKNTKRKTRQGKAFQNAKKAPRTLMELLHEANLETLPPHFPSYLRAAVGPPSSISRRHFCTVCGFTANYTCVRCGVRFYSSRCQVIQNDTRCLKFVVWPSFCVIYGSWKDYTAPRCILTNVICSQNH